MQFDCGCFCFASLTNDNNTNENEITLNGVWRLPFFRRSFIWYACKHKLLLKLVN